MPSLMLEVPETYDNITRPVIVGLIKDLTERLALPNNTKVQYLGNAEVAAQKGSLLARRNDDISFPFTGQVKVEHDEQYLENHTLTTATRSKENPAIFGDPTLGVSMHPIYTRTQSTLSFQYRAPDQVTASRWRDHLRRKLNEGLQALIHEIYYHYSVPDAFLDLLFEIYQKREAVEGYGDSFNDYLINHFTDRLTTLSNLDASRVLGSIAEKQIEVQGWMDIESSPEPAEKVDDGGTWRVEFTYTVQYDKVTGMVIHYPIVVHNQLLDEKFIDTRSVYTSHSPKPRTTTQSGRAFDAFRLTHDDLTHRGVAPVVIPPYDDWTPVGVGHRTLDMITSLVGVDFDDPTLTVDLTDLGETSFAEDVLTFLHEGREYLTDYLALPFLITFYLGRQMVNPNQVWVDDQLQVRTQHPLSARNVHHLKFSVLSDLRNLSPRGKEMVLNHPSVARKVVDLIYFYHDPQSVTTQRFPSKNRHIYNRQYQPGYPTHPGFTTGPNPHIKPRPGQWGPGRDGTIQPGGVGGSGTGSGSQPGDQFGGTPSDWLVETGQGRITERSWDSVVGNLTYTPGRHHRHVLMQTVMQAGIITHPSITASD